MKYWPPPSSTGSCTTAKSSRSTGPATGSRTASPPSRPPSKAPPPDCPPDPRAEQASGTRRETTVTTSPGPHSGDDTFDLIDDALATLAERRGAWLGDDLTAITLIARLNGHTWDEIARALATSPDQARLRYGPDSPVADSRWPYDWLTRPPSQLHNRATRTPLHANLYPTLHFGSYADTPRQPATSTPAGPGPCRPPPA